MPYTKIGDAPKNIRALRPDEDSNPVALSLEQVNWIARVADGITKGNPKIDSPWAVAIANFKRFFEVKEDKWVKKESKENMEEGMPLHKTLYRTWEDVPEMLRKMAPGTGQRAVWLSLSQVNWIVNKMNEMGINMTEAMKEFRKRFEVDEEEDKWMPMEDHPEVKLHEVFALHGDMIIDFKLN